MKRIRHLIFLLTVLAPSFAAATSTQYGESGLISVPSAEITGRGVYNASVWVNNSKSEAGKATRFPVSISMGIGSGWEFFGSYPDISFSNQEDGSMSNFGNVGIKFGLTGGPYSNLKTSGTFFIRQTVSENENITGLRDLGSRLLMSYSLAKADLHLNVGYLKVDSPGTETFNNEILFGSAVKVTISDKVKSFLELDGNTRREGGSSRIELSPGFQYYILPSVSMTGGIGFGLTDTGPDYRVIVGLTFSSGTGKYVKAIPIIPGSRERYAAMAETSIEELIPELPMEVTIGGIAQEAVVASIPGEAAPVVPSLEALVAFQAPSPISQAPMVKAGSKDVLTPGGLIGSPGMEAVPMEPPMPIILTTPVEKAVAMENIRLAPEVPAETSMEAFVPPLPVSEEKVEVIEAGKEKAEVHKEVTEEAGEGLRRTKKYYVIWYEFRSSELTPFAKGILDRVGVENKGSVEGLIVEIAGHTDSVGSAETNKKLSRKRAESAKNYLVTSHGLDPDVFGIKGYGEEMPGASNDTPEGREKNRRVEITVYSTSKSSEPAIALAPATEGIYLNPEVVEKTPPMALTPPLPKAVTNEKASEEPKTPPVVPLTPPAPLLAPATGAVASAAPSQPKEEQLKPGKMILYREILFLAEKPDPSPFVQGVLDKMAEEAKKKGKHLVIKIEGHADSKESPDSEKLSYDRANNVRDYLVKKHGLGGNAFVIKGYGSGKPVASNDAPEGMKKNRRVEITIFEAKD